jgi:hypothetical protein
VPHNLIPVKGSPVPLLKFQIAHIFCVCEALAALRQLYLGTFFLYPEDITSLSLGSNLLCSTPPIEGTTGCYVQYGGW